MSKIYRNWKCTHSKLLSVAQAGGLRLMSLTLILSRCALTFSLLKSIQFHFGRKGTCHNELFSIPSSFSGNLLINYRVMHLWFYTTHLCAHRISRINWNLNDVFHIKRIHQPVLFARISSCVIKLGFQLSKEKTCKRELNVEYFSSLHSVI